jgi:hypothetical protein
MDEPLARAKVNIHLANGTTVPTLVYDDEYDSDTDLGEHVESLVNQGPGRPAWEHLGDVFFHPQSVAAIELVEEYDTNEQEAT